MSTFYTIDTSQGWTSDPVNGTGVKLKWTYPTFLGHRDFRIYLQRSTSSNAAVNTNWPLKPYFQANGISNPVPTPEVGWETINTWYIPDSHSESLPNKWNDAMNQRPTINYYYRIIAYYTNQVGTTFKEYDWTPAPLTTAGKTPQWATQLYVNDPGNSYFYHYNQTPYASATDSLGNSYVVGDTSPYGNVRGIYISKFNSSGTNVWYKVYPGNTSDSRATDILIDKDGNLIITGWIGGIMVFDGHSIDGGTAGGNIFLMKFSTGSGSTPGTCIWATAFGGSQTHFIGDQGGYGVGTDSSGFFYVSGVFVSPMTVIHSDFSGATGSVALSPVVPLNQNAFLAKFATDGSVVWAKRFGSTESDLPKVIGRGVAVNSIGESFITGCFQGTSDFSQGTGTPLHSNSTRLTPFVAKFSTAGASLASIAFQVGGASASNPPGYTSGRQCKLDSLGNPIIGGIFKDGTLTIGSDIWTNNSPGDPDIFLTKLNPSTLVPSWSFHCGGTGFDDLNGLAIAPSGNIVFAGNFMSTMFVGSIKLTTVGARDIFVAALTSAGTAAWAVSFGSDLTDFAYGLSIGSDGTMYIPIYYSGSITFSPTVSLPNTTPSGAPNGAVFALSS